MFQDKSWRRASAILVLSCAALASQAQSPTLAGKSIDYRQAVFKVVGANFGPLAQQAQGKAELAPDAARKYAERLAAIVEFTRDAFPDISREGDTRARPEIWANRVEFDTLLDELATASRSLAAVTNNPSARPDDFKSAVAAVGNACKGCHDRFRNK